MEEQEPSGMPLGKPETFDENTPDAMPAPSPDTDVNDIDVYDAAQGYAAAQADMPGNTGLLREWQSRYPQYQEDLLNVSWHMWAHGPDSFAMPEARDEEEDPEIIAAGQAALKSLFPLAEALPPITSIIAVAKAKGLSVQDLANALHLDIPLLARLEQRLIRASTLPAALAVRLAAALDRSTTDVAAYLRGPQSLAAGAHYLAQQAPMVGSQVDFSTALQGSSPEVRAFWENDRDALGKD